MFSIREISDKIAAGESSGVEFKRVETRGMKIKAPGSDAISDEIAAFANHEGGIIIFGVEDDDKDISGIDDSALDNFKHFISRICSDSITPPIVAFYIDNRKIPNALGEEKNIVFVNIDKSLWLHKSRGGYFYRHGNTKREMSTEHILRVGQSRSQARIVRFEEQMVPQTDKETLQKDLYNQFIGTKTKDALDILYKRRLLTKEGDSYRATVSGVLMCNNNPRQYLPNSFIQAVYYRGETQNTNYQIDARMLQVRWISKLLMLSNS